MHSLPYKPKHTNMKTTGFPLCKSYEERPTTWCGVSKTKVELPTRKKGSRLRSISHASFRAQDCPQLGYPVYRRSGCQTEPSRGRRNIAVVVEKEIHFNIIYLYWICFLDILSDLNKYTRKLIRADFLVRFYSEQGLQFMLGGVSTAGSER